MSGLPATSTHKTVKTREGVEIIKEDKIYTLFVGDGPDIYVLKHDRIFRYRDGKPLENQNNLPSYVQKKLVPKPIEASDLERPAAKEAAFNGLMCPGCKTTTKKTDGKPFPSVGSLAAHMNKCDPMKRLAEETVVGEESEEENEQPEPAVVASEEA